MNAVDSTQKHGVPQQHDVPDLAARRQAVAPQHSCIVQAPAGSGKTELLTDRLLALLATVESPEEIVAITFTRKAAAEMHARVMKKLQQALDHVAQGSVPETVAGQQSYVLAQAVLLRDSEKNWRLMQNPQRLFISTIDAFCGSLVRRMPMLAQAGGTLAVGDDAGEQYRQAVHNILLSDDADPGIRDAVCLLLQHADNDTERLSRFLMAMLACRDQWLPILGGAALDIAQARVVLEHNVQLLVQEQLAEVAAIVHADLQCRLMPLARYAASNLRLSVPDHPVVRLLDWEHVLGEDEQDVPLWQALRALLLTSTGELRKARGVNKGLGFPEKDAYKQAFAELLSTLSDDKHLTVALLRVAYIPEVEMVSGQPAFYSETEWQALSALFLLTRRLVAELQLVFMETGVCDYIEVAARALQALGGDEAPTDLALALDYRIRHLLIDEFQDTSDNQNRLLQALTRGWESGDGRTLFLVGDPMQSIYRFRKADVGLFLQARDNGIGHLFLQSLQLSANFRSQHHVVDDINRRFALLLPAQDSLQQGAIRFESAVPCAVYRDGGCVQTHCLPALEKTAAREQEAQRVVTLVQQALAQTQQGKVAILLRTRKQARAIVEALQQAGVAFCAVDMQRLGERQIVRDAVMLARALWHPGDRLAWACVLRAPWCGLTLADLHLLLGKGDMQDSTLSASTAFNSTAFNRSEFNRSEFNSTVPELLAARLSLLSEDGQVRAGRIRAWLERAANDTAARPFAGLVKGCWQALGAEQVLQSDVDRADMQRFFDFLGDFCQRNGFSTQTFEQALQELYASADVSAQAQRVQLMTMHKSKGLQFDTVILPALNEKPRNQDSPLLLLDHGAGGVLMAMHRPSAETAQSKLYQLIRNNEKEREAHELRRLLYVACTRAERCLHLVAAVTPAQSTKDEETVSAKIEPGSLLSVLCLEPALRQQCDVAVSALSLAAVMDAPDEVFVPESRPLLRVQDMSTLPQAAPLSSPSWAKEPRSLPSGEIMAPDIRRIAGVSLHAWLERIARDGIAQWPAARWQQNRHSVLFLLRQQGLAGQALEQAAELVLRAVGNTLTHEQGRWLLSPHVQARSEWGLSSNEGDHVQGHALDRFFVDHEGVAWVVDYKLAEPAPGEPQAHFLAREIALYQPQLTRYAGLLAAQGFTAVRQAIWFASLPFLAHLESADQS